MTVTSIHDRSAAVCPSAPGRSEALNATRDRAVALLGDAFKHMLERADDLLFDFAERSEQSAEQNLYFEAMRELRLQRPKLLGKFEESLLDGFDKRRRRAAAGKPAALSDAARLAVVDDAGAGEQLGTEALVARITALAAEPMAELDASMAALLGVSELGPGGNPLAPHCVAEAAQGAITDLAVGFRIRIIVMKLFERYVASSVGHIYEIINRQLREDGPAPISPRRPARRQAIDLYQKTGTPAAPVQHQVTDVLGMLERLLPAGAQDAPALAIGRDPAADTETLTLLTRLQQADLATVDFSAADLGVLRTLHASGQIPSLGATGDMTVDIVAMLFDYILEDRNIPEAVRACVARLQIPVLKVALIDREFFSRKTHPARRLLNSIADAALQSAGDAQVEAAMTTAIERAVTRVVNEFESDLCVFIDSLGTVERACADIKRTAQARAAQANRMQDGRARLEHAKERARALLDTRLRPHGVPEVVRTFLLAHWKHLLITVCAQEGGDSRAMRTAVRTMDELVWSTLPKSTAEDCDKLSQLLPRLLQRLKKGMEFVSMPKMARASFLAKLASAHAEVIRSARRSNIMSSCAASTPRVPVLAVDPAAVPTESPDFLTKPSEAGKPAAEAPVSETLQATTIHPIVLAAVSGARSKQSTTLDPRRKAMLAAIVANVRRAHARQAEAAASIQPALPDSAVEPAAPAIGSTAASAAAQQPFYPRIPADIRQALHTIRTEPAELPSINLDADDSQARFALGILDEARRAAEELRERLDSEDEVALADVISVHATAPATQDALAQSPGADLTADAFYQMFSLEESQPYPSSGMLDIEEVTLGETGDLARQQDDEHLLKVKALQPGTWIEFRMEDGSSMRGRFTWYCASTDTFLFSDRNGRKVADRTLNGLVAEFRRGTAVVVPEDAPLLDRAFTRLMDRLYIG